MAPRGAFTRLFRLCSLFRRVPRFSFGALPLGGWERRRESPKSGDSAPFRRDPGLFWEEWGEGDVTIVFALKSYA